jgi:hypothetical protein
MNNEIEIREKVVLIRISKLYSESMTAEELYEATRGVWKVGPRRDEAEFAFSIANGEVKGIYKIESWLPAGTLKYQTRPRADIEVEGRWEFEGRLAGGEISDQYLGKSVKHYLPRGASNPITYINC